MSTLTEINSDVEWTKHSQSLPATTLQIIYFYADWAAPCKTMTTVLQALAATYPPTEPPTTSWVSINAESVIEVSDAYDVSSVPYLVLTRNNRVLETVSGSDPKKVRDAVERHATASSSAMSAGAGNTATEKKDTMPSSYPAKNLSTYAPREDDPAMAPAYSSGEQKESKEALHERLSTLVKAAPVMLFMKGTPSAPQCGFSRQLVALLREKSVKYGFFNILADDEVRQGLKEFADWPTFPQLWVEGELMGGLDIVKEEAANDPDFLKPFSVAKSSTVDKPQQQTATV